MDKSVDSNDDIDVLKKQVESSDKEYDGTTVEESIKEPENSTTEQNEKTQEIAEHFDELKDVEGEVKKLKYPRAIGFIVSNEFCERFNYYGMRTILVLYLTRKLDYDDDMATVLYHSFTTMVYFMCVFGAIIADSWLGKFRTILYLSILYVCGSTVIALGAIPTLNLPMRVMTMIGLLLIAFGSGGIKPCVSAFGGEQFKLPEQVAQLATFFSLFYFAVNSGSLVSTSVTPILREDVKCFGDDDCFSLAFGVPGVLMIVSIFIFVLGKPLYKIFPPAGNMFVKVSKCVVNAISTKSKEKKTNPREHWLDYAEKKYGRQLVDETRILLNILKLYLPLPLFWALFDQQGSRWTFQATHMDGDIGLFTIKPDQMQVVNPLLILIFIPLYEVALYPLLYKIGIRRPLQKLTLGGIFAGISFVLSGVIELQLEKTYPVMPSSHQSQLRIFNGVNCDYTLTSDIDNSTIAIKSMEYFEGMYLTGSGNSSFDYEMVSDSDDCENHSGKFEMEEYRQISYFIKADTVVRFIDDTQKSSKGYPRFRVLGNTGTNVSITFVDTKDKNFLERHKNGTLVMDIVESYPSNYDIYVANDKVLDVSMKLGGVYTYIIQEECCGKYSASQLVVTQSNSLNMLWLIPQYVVMTLGEVMFSVTGLEFSFTQAPTSMKSVIQGCWQLTVAVGNLIVVIIAEAKISSRQANEFFFFAGLMFVDMVIFSVLAYYYKPIALKTYDETDETDANTILPIDSTVSDTKDESGLANPAFLQ